LSYVISLKIIEDRQYNDQKKKDKRTNNDLHRKLMIEQHEPH
jgi:hypothetical protein